MKEKKYSRLTLAERRYIENALKANVSFKGIASNLSRSKDTISREILRNSIFRKTGGFGSQFNDCLHRTSCKEEFLCDKDDCRRTFCKGCILCAAVCMKYEKEYCFLLKKPPYVCNGCEKRKKCSLEKAIYNAVQADKTANKILHESRSGLNIDQAEIERLSSIVTPLIKKGQSPWHIANTQKDLLMVSDKTLYAYIAANLFEVSNIDLLRKVKMKPRRTKPQPKIEKACREGRTYREFLSYLEEYPDTAVVQMDTVIGKKGGGEKCLLTIHFPASQFMLAFLRNANTAKSVVEAFGWIKQKLGYNRFEEIFPLILTDNGSEFSNPSVIEFDEDGRRWTQIFYCDPNSSWQKGSIEANHRLLRMVFPSGKSLNDFSQNDINLAISHINSYARKSLGGLSPLNVFSRLNGNKMAKLLEVRLIESSEINLTPSLIK